MAQSALHAQVAPLRVLLLVYAFGAGIYAAFLPGKWVWFSWHPLMMMVGFVWLGGAAILQKKLGGLENTKLHGYLMGAAILASSFAWYVIYSNKEANQKPHLTSWHSWIGMAALLGYPLLGLVGMVALHPEMGVLRTNKTVRKVHKWLGRVTTASAWIACVVGFINMQKDLTTQVLFAGPLLAASYFVIL